MNERLLTINEVASLWQRNPQMIRRWVLSGLLPARKYGRDWLIREADLDTYREKLLDRKVGRPRKDADNE